jgi:exopolyphosphatase/guanosine-5'-triphosphate,3'-diphosphate pyrophosphatase
VSAAREIEAIATDYQRCRLARGGGFVGFGAGDRRPAGDERSQPDGRTASRREGLARLREQLLIRAGSAEALNLKGMRSDRCRFCPAAIAIMSAVFSELGIEQMTYSEGALPLGVLYDLLGRFAHHDTRDRRWSTSCALSGRREPRSGASSARRWPCSAR